MTESTFSLLLALGATLSFSSSSLIYARYSSRVSVLWMNCFKATSTAVALIFTICLFTGWSHIAPLPMLGFALSGLLGLNFGDLFLLGAFTRLGVGRTLILFGFQPLFVGLAAFFLFGQPLNPMRILAVLFLIACLFVFSLEKYRKEKRWELRGLLYALLGVCFDTCGILLSRAAFDASPGLSVPEGQFYRCAGALLGFGVISIFKPIKLIEGFRRWPRREQGLILAASLGGTYLALLLYLTALRVGHLASLAAIAVTGPIFATTLECLIYRKAPSRYLVVAFGIFLVGFYILLTTT